jgi:PAS domain S-box-containing protein
MTDDNYNQINQGSDFDLKIMDIEVELTGLIQENLDLRKQLSKRSAENKILATDLRKMIDKCESLEQSIKENREIYLLAIEAANLGIYDTEVKDKDLKLKENWLTRLGYDTVPNKDEDQTWEALIHPDDRERVISEFQKEVQGDVDSLTLEYRLRAADGNYRWILESSKIIGVRKISGKSRIVGTHFDITQRKLAEEAEREQRAFADALSESAAVFSSTLNLNEVLNLILVNVGKVVLHDDSDIWLIDKNYKNVHPALRKAMDGTILPTSSAIISIEECKVFQEIVSTRKPVYLPDIKPDSFPIPSRNPDSRSCICTPVLFGSFLLGFLVINSSKKNYFNQIHILRLQAFANQAAIAIRNAQLYSQAQEAAALEERQRLAREMHDVVSQTLFSASIQAEALPYLVDSEPIDNIKNRLYELHRLTRGALAEMRTMLMELRPNAIVNTDMGNLLQQLVDGLAGRTTAKIELSCTGVGLLPAEVQTAFFRITQEAINNVLKHSKAKRIRIEFINQKESAFMRVEDNGCGFNLANIANERMGVRIMRERADSINANLVIKSHPGKGTKIILDWKKA